MILSFFFFLDEWFRKMSGFQTLVFKRTHFLKKILKCNFIFTIIYWSNKILSSVQINTHMCLWRRLKRRKIEWVFEKEECLGRVVWEQEDAVTDWLCRAAVQGQWEDRIKLFSNTAGCSHRLILKGLVGLLFQKKKKKNVTANSENTTSVITVTHW